MKKFDLHGRLNRKGYLLLGVLSMLVTLLILKQSIFNLSKKH